MFAALQEASGSYKGLANRQGDLHPHFVKQVELFGSSKNFAALLAEESFLHKLTEANRKARAKNELVPLLLELQEAVLPVIEEARSPQNTFLRLAHLVKMSQNLLPCWFRSPWALTRGGRIIKAMAEANDAALDQPGNPVTQDRCCEHPR